MAASVQKYLQSKMDDHCLDWAINVAEMSPDDPDFESEIRSHKELMEMSLWRNWEIIDTAYYMKIPKKALYRFGYTKAEINEECNDIFGHDYPY